jgi:hypothetical protein
LRESKKIDNVDDFLKELKKKVCSDGIRYIRRAKNEITLDKLGFWNEEYAIARLSTLEKTDLKKGNPKEDRNDKFESIWEFKKHICGLEIYIKIGVPYDKTSEFRLISFHEDD